MKKKYYFAKIAFSFVLAFLLNGSSQIFAQLNVGGQPMSSMMEMISDFNIVSMPEINTKKLIEEDEAVKNIPDMPLRYATVLDVNYTLENSGTWELLTDGSRVWRLSIKSSDAKCLNIIYKNFFMPKGATFFVYNPSKGMVLGAFSELNNTEDKQFATAPTLGNTVVLEYYEPVYSKGKGSITISKVVHAYKDILGFSSPMELPCNININCPIGAPWVDQKRSVARMTFTQGGSGFLCTGSLMNNTLNNRVPYFLTAEHCASDNWASLVVDFNYESLTCGGSSTGPSQSLTGATLKASNFDTDFRLLQLTSTVPASINAYYNGWDRSGSTPTNETAIHHPGGAIKKISHDNDPASSVTGFGGRLANGFWLMVWDQGMTEGGSSGCPLYDQNKRAIGQNLGGTTAQCENPQVVQKYFGKLSESWAHGGSTTNQLKDWLDPNNSGAMVVDGMDDVSGVAPVSNFTSNVQSLPIGGGTVDFYDLTTNAPTTWSWSFPGATPSTSTDRNPTGISYSATGPYTVSLTTSNGFGSNLKTIVGYVRVAGEPLNTFSLVSPPNGSRLEVSPTDNSLFQFNWGSSGTGSTIKYKFKIKKVGPGTEYLYQSNNNGADIAISLRKSFLDSLVMVLGPTGDSALCIWRATSYNGLDSVTTSNFTITIRRNTVGINQISAIVPEKFSLYNNYPNPFNPKTVIKFDVSKNQLVRLKVYNLLGEEVATLVNQNLNPGSYAVDFDASQYASGMYFYRIESQGYTETKRMMLIK